MGKKDKGDKSGSDVTEKIQKLRKEIDKIKEEIRTNRESKNDTTRKKIKYNIKQTNIINKIIYILLY